MALSYIPGVGRFTGVSIPTRRPSRRQFVSMPRVFTLFDAPTGVRGHDLSPDEKLFGLVDSSSVRAGSQRQHVREVT